MDGYYEYMKVIRRFQEKYYPELSPRSISCNDMDKLNDWYSILEILMFLRKASGMSID